MNILITGGAGFQGSHLTNFLLNQGHAVTILNTSSKETTDNITHVDPRAKIVLGSITDKVVVDKTISGQEVVFHLAANVNVDHSLKDPRSFLEVNIIGTFNILEAVREQKIRMIHASTCEVYGDGHTLKEGELLNESAALLPNSPYAASKVGAERLCYSYYKSYGVDVTILRPFNIYGERQKAGSFGALIPILVRKALAGEALTVYGDGTATRDYMNIDDLVAAYNLVLQNETLSGQAINFASGVNTRVKDIAEYIAKKLDATIEYGPARPGEVLRFPADLTLATSLGFTPQVDIWEGIDRYIEWVKGARL